MSDHIRASDRDRERTIEALREAAGEGRLTVDELDERLTRAHGARTRGDLLELMDDLFVPAASVPAPRPRRLPWVPGRVPFGVRWAAEVAPRTAVVEFMDTAARPLFGFGYELRERGSDRLVFVRRRRPGWTIAVAILLFPVGLIALVHTEHDVITVDFVREGGRTLGFAQGVAPLPVRQAFARLED